MKPLVNDISSGCERLGLRDIKDRLYETQFFVTTDSVHLRIIGSFYRRHIIEKLAHLNKIVMTGLVRIVRAKGVRE